MVRVRLPDARIRRLDRSLDWRATSGRVKFSRNAARREALRLWLEDQEPLAGFVSPETLRGPFRAAYDHVSPGHPWVLIPRLRPPLQWPQERFDTVVEGLRADGHVELARAKPDETHATATQESSTGHGHLSVRRRWRDGGRPEPVRLLQAPGRLGRGDGGPLCLPSCHLATIDALFPPYLRHRLPSDASGPV